MFQVTRPDIENSMHVGSETAKARQHSGKQAVRQTPGLSLRKLNANFDGKENIKQSYDSAKKVKRLKADQDDIEFMPKPDDEADDCADIIPPQEQVTKDILLKIFSMPLLSDNESEDEAAEGSHRPSLPFSLVSPLDAHDARPVEDNFDPPLLSDFSYME